MCQPTAGRWVPSYRNPVCLPMGPSPVPSRHLPSPPSGISVGTAVWGRGSEGGCGGRVWGVRWSAAARSADSGGRVEAKPREGKSSGVPPSGSLAHPPPLRESATQRRVCGGGVCGDRVEPCVDGRVCVQGMGANCVSERPNAGRICGDLAKSKDNARVALEVGWAERLGADVRRVVLAADVHKRHK